MKSENKFMLLITLMQL